jgi:hypothetical protein
MAGGRVHIGPPAEHLVYLNDAHMRAERHFFWLIVTAMMETEPGTDPDSLPRWMTEDATADLVTNKPMES